MVMVVTVAKLTLITGRQQEAVVAVVVAIKTEMEKLVQAQEEEMVELEYH